MNTSGNAETPLTIVPSTPKQTAKVGTAKVDPKNPTAKVKKTAKVKTAKVKAPKAPKVKADRKKFFYLRAKNAKYGVLSAKVENLAEALTVHGLKESDLAESKALSTNRHDSVVMYCDILDAIPDAPATAEAKA